MCWRQYLACRRLKIHHIEGLVRRSNYTVALLQGIEPANKFLIRDFARREKAGERTSKKARAGQQRTCRHHL